MAVWNVLPVEERPEVELIQWRVFETLAGVRHFVGCETLGFCGRVSSAIKQIDADKLRGIPSLGRVYQLSGQSGFHPYADYVWLQWSVKSCVESYKNVTVAPYKETAMTTYSRVGELDADSAVLYLDFDNCTHRSDAYKTADGIVSSDPSVTFFEFAGVLDQLLAAYPSVLIVLSTSWVEALGFEDARDSLPIASLRARVVGSTFNPKSDLPHIWSLTPRGRQIRRHVATHGIKRWLALDDMREGFEGAEEHLVHCQPGVGLGDKDVQRVLAERLLAMCARGALLRS